MSVNRIKRRKCKANRHGIKSATTINLIYMRELSSIPSPDDLELAYYSGVDFIHFLTRSKRKTCCLHAEGEKNFEELY